MERGGRAWAAGGTADGQRSRSSGRRQCLRASAPAPARCHAGRASAGAVCAGCTEGWRRCRRRRCSQQPGGGRRTRAGEPTRLLRLHRRAHHAWRVLAGVDLPGVGVEEGVRGRRGGAKQARPPPCKGQATLGRSSKQMGLKRCCAGGALEAAPPGHTAGGWAPGPHSVPAPAHLLRRLFERALAATAAQLAHQLPQLPQVLQLLPQGSHFTPAWQEEGRGGAGVAATMPFAAAAARGKHVRWRAMAACLPGGRPDGRCPTALHTHN